MLQITCLYIYIYSLHEQKLNSTIAIGSLYTLLLPSTDQAWFCGDKYQLQWCMDTVINSLHDIISTKTIIVLALSWEELKVTTTTYPHKYCNYMLGLRSQAVQRCFPSVSIIPLRSTVILRPYFVYSIAIGSKIFQVSTMYAQ